MQKNGVLVRCFDEWFTVCLQKLPLKIKMRLSAQSKSDLGCFDPDLIDIYWFAFTKWSWPLGPQPNHTKVGWAPKSHPIICIKVGWARNAHPIKRTKVAWALGAHPTFFIANATYKWPEPQVPGPLIIWFGCGPKGHDHFVKATNIYLWGLGQNIPDHFYFAPKCAFLFSRAISVNKL